MKCEYCGGHVDSDDDLLCREVDGEYHIAHAACDPAQTTDHPTTKYTIDS